VKPIDGNFGNLLFGKRAKGFLGGQAHFHHGARVGREVRALHRPKRESKIPRASGKPVGSAAKDAKKNEANPFVVHTFEIRR
jgi:hypothetical protein